VHIGPDNQYSLKCMTYVDGFARGKFRKYYAYRTKNIIYICMPREKQKQLRISLLFLHVLNLSRNKLIVY